MVSGKRFAMDKNMENTFSLSDLTAHIQLERNFVCQFIIVMNV